MSLPPVDQVDPDQPAIDDPRVEAAVARLADTEGRPAAEHVEVFEDVHRRLQEALAGLDGET